MKSAADLQRQWDKTRRVENGFTRVETSPLECYIGYDGGLCRSLRLSTGAGTKNLQPSKIVGIRQWRSGGRWILEMSLLSEAESEVFVEMCRDLLNFSEGAASSESAFQKFQRRYRQWQKLFAAGHSGLLSGEEQRGLIGELLFLRGQILSGREPAEAVGGWHGPLTQDFSYSEKWYEIKTVLEKAEKVKISSLEQLSRGDAGELVVFRLAKISGGADSFPPEKFTLNSLAEDLRQILEDSASADDFDSRLIQAGYISREEYGADVYRTAEIMNFETGGNFPRLLRENLPPEIVEASYSLSLSALKCRKDGKLGA